MKLSIDTANSENIIVGLGKKRITETSKEAGAQKLLTVIEREVKRQAKVIGDVSEVKVNTGLGSFTGLRVGVAVANALGWVLSVPVNGQVVVKDGPVETKY